MHYLTLITAEIPEITEDEQTNEAVKAQIDKLENEKESFPEKSSGILNLLIAACNSIRDEFSRAVASAATDILEPYHCDTENPDYLEFWDKTPELEAAYEQSIDCFLLPQGKIVTSRHPAIYGRYTIRNGNVYETHAGPLHHEKRTKAAKRIKALPYYPIKKLYLDFSDYAEEYWGVSYHPEQEAYGFYYNPNAFFDWYSIGGRWPDLFLVKEDCAECSIGEKSFLYDNVTIPCPEGYKWVCAARKKDIEWQAMRDWRILGARKHFQSLEKLFLTGERDKDIYGMVTEEGIVNCGRLIYEKGETEEHFLAHHKFNELKRYPICFYAFLSDGCWNTQYDLSDSNNNDPWDDTQGNYIDSLSDDTVLIGVDLHA